MKIFTVQKQIKLDRFLLDEYQGELSYSTFRKLLRNKDIKVNDKRVNDNITLYSGDIVKAYYDGEKKKIPLNILFNEQGVLAFDKPKGITAEDFEVLVKKEYPNAKLVHRLDRNTTGILLLAQTEDAYNELLIAFKNRKIHKYYLAEVYGKLDKKEDVLTAYLVKDEKSSLVKIYDNQVAGSQKIITGYKVLKEYENSTLVEVELFTGKTHQIRAHFAHIGHFVIGDGKYGKNTINSKFKEKTQKLKGYKIVFEFEKDDNLFLLNGREIIIK